MAFNETGSDSVNNEINQNLALIDDLQLLKSQINLQKAVNGLKNEKIEIGDPEIVKITSKDELLKVQNIKEYSKVKGKIYDISALTNNYGIKILDGQTVGLFILENGAIIRLTDGTGQMLPVAAFGKMEKDDTSFSPDIKGIFLPEGKAVMINAKPEEKANNNQQISFNEQLKDYFKPYRGKLKLD